MKNNSDNFLVVRNLALLVVIIFTFIKVWGIIAESTTHYQLEAKVVTATMIEITVKDINGRFWFIDKKELIKENSDSSNNNKLKENDKVIITLHTSFTDNTIVDDFVENISLIK